MLSLFPALQLSRGVQQPGLKVRIIIREMEGASYFGVAWRGMACTQYFLYLVPLCDIIRRLQRNLEGNTPPSAQKPTFLLAIKGATFLAAITAHEPSIYMSRRTFFISRMRQTLGIFIGGGPVSLSIIRIPFLRQRESERRSGCDTGSRGTCKVLFG